MQRAVADNQPLFVSEWSSAASIYCDRSSASAAPIHCDVKDNLQFFRDSNNKSSLLKQVLEKHTASYRLSYNTLQYSFWTPTASVFLNPTSKEKNQPRRDTACIFSGWRTIHLGLNLLCLASLQLVSRAVILIHPSR